MTNPEYLISPRAQQPGNRNNDIKLQQLDIRMQRLEKTNQELTERLAVLEAKQPVLTKITPDPLVELRLSRGPGRPRKEQPA